MLRRVSTTRCAAVLLFVVGIVLAQRETGEDSLQGMIETVCSFQVLLWTRVDGLGLEDCAFADTHHRGSICG